MPKGKGYGKGMSAKKKKMSKLTKGKMMKRK